MATKKVTTPAKTTTKKVAAPKAAATKATKPAAKKAAKPSTAMKFVSKVEDNIEAIRAKAEEIYHARVAKGEHGTPESDWLQAEKEVKAKKK